MISEIVQENDVMEHFASSLNLAVHPMCSSSQKMKDNYNSVLKHLLQRFQVDSDFLTARLTPYHDLLTSNANRGRMVAESTDNVIHSFAMKANLPWNRKYLYCLFSDLALILLREEELKDAYKRLRIFLSRQQQALLDEFCGILWSSNKIPKRFLFSEPIISQVRKNHMFLNKPLARILVTATMSAGKSTLINALVGEDILETRNEACTDQVYRVFNKPFHDGMMNRKASDTAVFVDSFKEMRLCFIDTPGVNSARHPAHSEIAQDEIKAGQYDLIVYIFNARYNGTVDDDLHLHYVLNNKPKSVQTVFVLNQLDAFNEDDSVEDSLNILIEHLNECGISEPIVCPVSAKAARLAHRVSKGMNLDGTEKKWFDAYAEDFTSQRLDLSSYYNNPLGADESLLLSQCGIRGLEHVLLNILEGTEKYESI